ncbi:DUF3221 domain-containing protein [Oceanobacillus saliphilus]|uniref:DUF3221 domain-containing protein n=1 Tax=Oceanobacillus saliphilus TaxID=2925834 RepID=UPI00201DCB9B|nr:DUF3221 domain-containing protein [Oceanobacillus saliphilus]
MVAPPPYKRLLLACLLVVFLYFAMNEWTPKEAPDDLPDGYMRVEGYVAFKSFDSIWLTEAPVSIWETLTFNLITPNYTIVSRHEEASKFNLFNGFRVNHRVRVYGDILMESSPAKINAYYIEKIRNK